MQSTLPRSLGWRTVSVVGPFVLALFQVVGTFGAAHNQPDRRALDAFAIVLLVAGPLTLLFLRQRTVAVVWTTVAITLVYFLRDFPYGPVVASVVIAAVFAVIRGHRLAAWLGIGVLYGGHFVGRVLLGLPWSWMQVLLVGAWALVVLILGEVARVRRERVVAARQARAETERREANEERLRIARELHDVVAHHMSLINVQAGVALHVVDRRPEQVETALAAIKDASKEALTELRSLVDLLRDQGEAAPRGPASMLGSLDELVDRTAHAGLTMRKHVEGSAAPLPAPVELAAFRIVQEAVTNIVRHSGATQADIVLRYGEHDLTIRVDDNGRGRASVDSDGSGIRGMR
ncbi:MAG: sensor histidine kinase, partial [Nocardioidaceae bacterium]